VPSHAVHVVRRGCGVCGCRDNASFASFDVCGAPVSAGVHASVAVQRGIGGAQSFRRGSNVEWQFDSDEQAIIVIGRHGDTLSDAVEWPWMGLPWSHRHDTQQSALHNTQCQSTAIHAFLWITRAQKHRHDYLTRAKTCVSFLFIHWLIKRHKVVTSQAAFLPRELSLVLITSAQEGMARLSGLDKYWDGIDPPKVVTNPITNRARRSLTFLTWRTPLPLRQTRHQREKSRNKKQTRNKQETNKKRARVAWNTCNR